MLRINLSIVKDFTKRSKEVFGEQRLKNFEEKLTEACFGEGLKAKTEFFVHSRCENEKQHASNVAICNTLFVAN